MKRELHTLYIKHDGAFKTLSKIALSQLILKIIYLKGDGALKRQILTELESVLLGSVNTKDVEDAISLLITEKKVNTKREKYFIHADYQSKLKKAENDSEVLHKKVLDKYFSKAETHIDFVKIWFQETTIKFFEQFSFEWFHQKTSSGKNGSIIIPNLDNILDETLLHSKNLVEKDKDWLKQQYVKFVESQEAEDDLLFWYYGITMFSSRLITARNYADEISIEMFKGSKFILDTNILMILDLEAHELNESLKCLEAVLLALQITPIYFNCTREEYIKAMSWRKQETINVFNNYDIEVLRASDCPFIQTALRRGCMSEADIERMFTTLVDIPSMFHKLLAVKELDYRELHEAIDEGRKNEELKTKINAVYKKRTKRDKRENPKTHDAGMISGAYFVRKNEKCWIITVDGTMKLFAIDNCLRDENEIAVGLDVVLGLMAVNSGGVNIEASNFAPLFKNLVRYSLIPESDAFEVRDLAFMLSTNTKVQELPTERVIEVAREVKKMRISGKTEENVALYLRRVIEGDKLGLGKDIQEAREKESIEKTRRERAESENRVWAEEFRGKRRGELRDQYDTNLRRNRVLFFAIPTIVATILFLTIKNFVLDESALSQFFVGLSIEIIFGIIPLFPINKRLIKRHSEYVTGIDSIVENEIIDLRKKAD